MRTSVEYKSEKYGLFIITQESKNKFTIWWDFYDEHEGDALEPDYEVWIEECDVRDFSDMPKYGEFKTHDDAYNYIVKKFGKIK